MHDDQGSREETALVSSRSMDIGVALLFLAVSAVVIYDSARIGIGWLEGQGPASGYFPFYIAAIMGFASLVNLVRAVRSAGLGGSGAFVSRRALGRVLLVFAPTLLYVALIGGIDIGPIAIPGLGIYVASALFIAGFMLSFDRHNPLKALAVGLAVPFALFLMFEKWFLVPLPKGPLEAMLGY